MRLEELDQIFDDTPGFRVVGTLKLDESGVDPIGLRQLNLDLMDATVPGINNVTTHIRPYTFMAWAWWRASQYADWQGITPAAIQDLVERYEAIYAWSHSAAGRPFRGNISVRKWLNPGSDTDTFRFSGSEWESYKRERTGFMAPTEYGPSIKSLHFLKPEGGLFGWASEAMPAILAIDAVISEVLPGRLLLPEPPTVTISEIEPLAYALPVDEATEEEKAVFLHLFYEIGKLDCAGKDMRRRQATIDLLRTLLEESPLDIEDIRRRLASFTKADAREENELEILNSSLMLCHLQARQLQRLATETMMLWIEVFLAEVKGQSRTTDEIILRAHECAKEGDPIYATCLSLGDYVEALEETSRDKGWPASAAGGESDVVGLMTRLQQAQQRNVSLIPALVLRSFAVARAITKAFANTTYPPGVLNSIESRPDRLPLGMMARRMDGLLQRPLSFIWREIIESWIVGQHVHWSAVRGGEGKKRLRIGLEGDGWMLVRPRPSAGFRPTPDRLWTLLSLATACGLFKRVGSGHMTAS